MDGWNDRHPECSNCRTTYRKHMARGLCTRCYHLRRAIDIAERWTAADMSPGGKAHTYVKQASHTHDRATGDRNVDPERFRRVRKNYIEQYLHELNWRAHIGTGMRREGAPDGPTVEWALAQIGNLCGVDGYRIFYGEATGIDWTLERSQKAYVYSLMMRIEDRVRWGGVNFRELYEAARGSG